jgi:hypothetical protein
VVWLTLLGCGSNPVTYLVSDGYVGPVVVVFADPSGGAAIRGEDGGETYQIPADGVLRLSTPAPPGTHEMRFFYVGADGARRKVPYGVDEDTLQAFAHVAGATGEDDAGKVTNWHAFVVGVPSERDDWIEVRERATFQAIGVSGYPSSYEERWSEEER